MVPMRYQASGQRFWRRHPWITIAASVFTAWLVLHGHVWPAAVILTGAAFSAVRGQRRARAIERAGLRARADLEHRLVLAGDPRGVHGRFPPQQAGWFPDPARPDPRSPAPRGRIRYFDGVAWTALTASRR